MTNETAMRVTAFVRSIANECRSCMHRTIEHCRDCVANDAKHLLSDIMRESVQQPEIDYSFNARKREIVRILTESGKPLLAKEIDLRQTCSPQLKCWTLNQMVYKGIISRKFAFRSRHKKRAFFFYFLNNKETETNENHHT